MELGENIMAKHNPKGAGRKPLLNDNIDKQAFENCCIIQCTQQEIADWFACSPDTIDRWVKKTYGVNFAEIYSQKRGRGKVSLRRSQWRLATEKLNPTMLIWLGKNLLDQSDKILMSDDSEKLKTTNEIEILNRIGGLFESIKG